MLVTLPPVRGGLEPVEAALADLRRRRGADATRGLAPGLRLPWPTADWLPASALVSGERLDETLDVAQRRWGAPAATAAALAWRSYTYWLAMPVVLGWATARRVPLADRLRYSYRPLSTTPVPRSRSRGGGPGWRCCRTIRSWPDMTIVV